MVVWSCVVGWNRSNTLLTHLTGFEMVLPVAYLCVDSRIGLHFTLRGGELARYEARRCACMTLRLGDQLFRLC